MFKRSEQPLTSGCVNTAVLVKSTAPFASVLALCVTELSGRGAGQPFINVVFESFSAFGTVGLSLGLTPQLTAAGKLVIILTMFAGRVGLITIAIARPLPERQQPLQYASEKVLVG